MSQTVLITGASGGIGRACALEFARHGLRPVLVARSEEKLRVLRDEIQRESGLEALILPADLCEEGAAQALLEALDAQGVEVDVLVNNAGFGDYAAFLDARVGQAAAHGGIEHPGAYAPFAPLWPAHARARPRADPQHRLSCGVYAGPLYVGLLRL